MGQHAAEAPPIPAEAGSSDTKPPSPEQPQRRVKLGCLPRSAGSE